ncbi:MAG TPA: tetratricopeptide repeat protein [Polyangiaceae bacterium]|jgi:tetratricopeptide (TPR) repeat protein|nr:tetratricopeptide repeat protein [Polyangiaceae bacterium]
MKHAVAIVLLALALPSLCGCAWDPSRPFDRDAPQVTRALGALDAGEAGAASSALEEYLSTGDCKDGIIGTPDLLKKRPDGTFDLGLALFRLGEQYGRRFGDEESNEGVTEAIRAKRHAQIECARRVVQAIAEDDTVPGDVRARAHYLSGNLAFLDGDYKDAVEAYDRALVLVPGDPDSGDSLGRDAAYNRAIALRRIDDDKKDSGSDASPGDSGSPDASREPDAGRDSGPDSKDAGAPDASGGGQDAGKDAEPPPPEPPPDAGPEPPREAGAVPPANTDEDQRMLDQLESAPTLQQEEAKRFGKKRVRGMADK